MTKSKDVRSVAIAGMAGNIFLLTIKLIVGFMSKSQSMIADGLNSAGDVFASVMTYIGNHISSQPDDQDHPYGHGKAEYIFSMVISFSLVIVAFNIITSSINALTNQETFIFTPWLIIVAIITIGLKIGLFIISNRIGHKYKSLLALANAEDHRNDVFITCFTLLSIITGYFDLYIIDAIVGSAIGIWIGYTGFTIFSSAYNVLMDTTIDKEVQQDLIDEIEVLEGVDHVDIITSKPVGLKFLLIVKVSVDGTMTISQGHSISDVIKHQLMNYDYVDDVIVHLNPTQEHPEKNYLR